MQGLHSPGNLPLFLSENIFLFSTHSEKNIIFSQCVAFFFFFGVAQARRAGGTRGAREASRDDLDGADVEGQTGGDGQGRERKDGGANVRQAGRQTGKSGRQEDKRPTDK